MNGGYRIYIVHNWQVQRSLSILQNEGYLIDFKVILFMFEYCNFKSKLIVKLIILFYSIYIETKKNYFS